MSNPIKQFQDFFQEYEVIVPYLSISDQEKEYIEHKKGWIERLSEVEFPVAFFGSFNAGKSTIINTILGEVILPASNESTTACPTLIKKGNQDKAEIFYIDEKAKEELWKSLAQEIGLIVHANFDKKEGETLKDNLARIVKTVAEYQQGPTATPIDSKFISTLKQLYSGWSDSQYQSQRSIDIQQVKEYGESHPGAIFMDRIEISINNNNLPDDIVIVDLPGLGVINKRHLNFTKDYIQNKAKAFVVSMKTKHLIEGQELKFLQQINKDYPTIVQRSFWVINAWDTLTDQQKKEEEQNFDKKVEQYKLSVNNERVFKFSALNYFLLSSIADNSLKRKPQLKVHQDSLKMYVNDVDSVTSEQALDFLKNQPELKDFYKFKTSLFDYLSTNAKNEFFADARYELDKIINIIQENLRPFYEESEKDNTEEIKSDISAIETNKQFDILFEGLKEKINKFAEEIRISTEDQFWKNDTTNKVQKALKDKISQLDREHMKNQISKGEDTEGSLSRLPAVVETSLNLTSLLRLEMVKVLEDNFIKKLNTLFENLINNDLKENLPQSLVKQLEDKLNSRDITLRINGLADAVLYNYGKTIENIGLNLGDKIKDENDIDQKISKALKEYEEVLNKFIVEEFTKDINQKIRRTIKNHAEYVEVELLKILDNNRDSIVAEVARNIKVSDVIQKEINKRELISNCYTKMNKIKGTKN